MLNFSFTRSLLNNKYGPAKAYSIYNRYYIIKILFR